MLRYYREIVAMDLDIALAPLADNAFNRCKSNIKLLEYGIAGVPIIASMVGPYFHGYGMTAISRAGTPSEWFDSLEALIEHSEYRVDNAQRNLEVIRSKYTMEAGMAAWKRVMERAASVTV
jgi:hypothetical protein